MGPREQEDQRGRKGRVAADPVSLSHLLSVCLLSALFSLSQESNDFSTVLFPNLQRHLPSTPFSLLSSLSTAVEPPPHSSPLPLTFHSPNRKSLKFPHSPVLLLPLLSTPPFSLPSSCWPGEQLTKSKGWGPWFWPRLQHQLCHSPLPTSFLLWPLALAPLSAAPAQTWRCLAASDPALPGSQLLPVASPSVSFWS